MASGAFNLQKLNCQFLKNVSHLLNAPHFATSVIIKKNVVLFVPVQIYICS